MHKITYVSVSNGRIVYRPRITKKLRSLGLPEDKNGFLKPPVCIGKVGDDDDKIMAAYLAAKEKLTAKKPQTSLYSISAAYLESAKFKEKSPETQRGYRVHAKAILSHPIKIGGQPSTLGEVLIDEITKPDINKIREIRLNKYLSDGKKGTVAVNRQVAYLQTMTKWALNYMPEMPDMINPFNNIDKFKEQKNTVYVSHEQLEKQCVYAAQVGAYLPVLIKFSYLTGCRGVEALEVEYDDLTADGVYIKRRKGSKSNTVAWTPSLGKVVDEAKALPNADKNNFLIVGEKGGNLTQSGVQTAMQKLKKLMQKAGDGEHYFTLHKTKSKAQSDSKDAKISGLSKAMQDRYSTKKDVVDAGLEI